MEAVEEEPFVGAALVQARENPIRTCLHVFGKTRSLLVWPVRSRDNTCP
jgi:hypothetical protein